MNRSGLDSQTLQMARDELNQSKATRVPHASRTEDGEIAVLIVEFEAGRQ